MAAPDRQDAAPFPGLSAFTEIDAGIFFGRDTDILRGLDRLRILRRNDCPRILLIQAASGAGKSSYLRAGIWPRLERDSDFHPIAILRPAQGILTGPDGIGRKLAVMLSRPAHPINPGDIHAQLMGGDQAKALAAFKKLMAEAGQLALELRRIGDKQAPSPGAPPGDRPGRGIVRLRRSGRERTLPVPAGAACCPIRHRASSRLQYLRSAPTVPTRLLETLTERSLSSRRRCRCCRCRRPPTATLSSSRSMSSRGAGRSSRSAPRLRTGSSKMRPGRTRCRFSPSRSRTFTRSSAPAAAITLEQYEAMGGVAGSIEMALKRALAIPGAEPAIPATKDEQLACLRAAFIPWLARVDPATGLPMRRVARIEEIPPGSRAIVARLVDSRLLVADRRFGTDIVDVAHESLLRQWPALTEWLKADAADLQLVDAVERAAGEWTRNGRHDAWLDHRAERLRSAERVATQPDFRKRLGDDGVDYIAACRRRETTERQQEGAHLYARRVFERGDAGRARKLEIPGTRAGSALLASLCAHPHPRAGTRTQAASAIQGMHRLSADGRCPNRQHHHRIAGPARRAAAAHGYDLPRVRRRPPRSDFRRVG